MPLLDSFLKKLSIKLNFSFKTNCCNQIAVDEQEEGKMSAHEVKQQLHMMHNPFSTATSQPKIPDGKTNDSLGFATQVVTEVGNAVNAKVMHLLLYPGMNGGIVCEDVAQSPDGGAFALDRTYYIPTYDGSNGLDWTGLTDSTVESTISNPDNYALWRIVSQGLQLKLLNPTDQDDGWWEAIRLSTAVDNPDYRLTTGNNSALNAGDSGCIAPVSIVKGQLSAQNLSNESSYSTGLLRDLHRVQFELHGQKDYHDFIHMRDDLLLDPNSVDNLTLGYDTRNDCNGVPGEDSFNDIIKQNIDLSYDMVYIRCYCRPNTGVSPFLGSRLHLNVVSNQEIVFDPIERESRFQTKSHSIGADPTSIHCQGRRADQNAAKLVPNI